MVFYTVLHWSSTAICFRLYQQTNLIQWHPLGLGRKIQNNDEAGILDLDDCAFYWFEADIAFALRDLFEDSIDKVDFQDQRLSAFLRGYRREIQISDAAVSRIPLFLRMDHESALAIFDFCVKKRIKGYICSHEITTLSYFLEKQKYDVLKRNKIINNLLDHLSVLVAHENILRKALVSEIKDYEDAVIDELALHGEIDYIITRDLKDFKSSRNTICNAREALDRIEVD
jgi:predicted nucleic acid-binding protein